MRKIVRQIIKDTYTSLDIETLLVDSIIDFNCYIKRLNGYVIVIEKGTLITKSLLKQVQVNKEFYIDVADKKKHQDYLQRVGIQNNFIDLEALDTKELSDLEQAIEDVKALPRQIQKYETGQEKLQLAYKNACDLIYFIFEEKETREKLPLAAIESFIDVALHLVVSKEGLFNEYVKMTPAQYQINYHSVNVCILSIFLGNAVGLNYSELKQLAMAGMLHDIGKGCIQRSILDKEVSLDPDEYELVQTHSTRSAELAGENGITDKRILDGILYHHEKFDGTGYPEGLREKKIPKMAQIISICDAFDALTTDRTFRKKYSSFDALSLMREEMSKHLNQDYIKKFIQLLANR